VDFVDPVIDPATRTAQVRLVLRNPQNQIKPGLFVEAVIEAEVGSAELTVPASAPLFAGERALVYVEAAGGERPRYVPRVVRLGARLGDRWEILAGLEEGERVVSEGAFVIDADLQIQGGDSLMSLPGAEAAPPAPIYRELTAAERRRTQTLLERHLDFTGALASDDLEDAGAALGRVADAAAALPLRLSAIGERIAALARPGLPSLRAARARLLQLEPLVQDLLRMTGNPLDTELRLAFCPMADGDRGATWLQTAPEVENAYFGEEMFRCGEIRHTLAPGEHLPPRTSGDGASRRSAPGPGARGPPHGPEGAASRPASRPATPGGQP
jgi:Cu(I)/Ag(I) efflux system membrane fusion protein